MAHTELTVRWERVLRDDEQETVRNAANAIYGLQSSERVTIKLEVVEPKRTVRIRQDTDPSNPRIDHDNVGVMFCKHRRYALGDKDAGDPIEEVEFKVIDGIEITDDQYRNDSIPAGIDRRLLDDAWDAADWKSERRLRDDIAVCLPLYLYDHSGLSISHGTFSCPWDSGQVGWHYVTKDAVQREFGGDIGAAKQCLKGELEEYDHYLRGNVWGFEVLDEYNEIVDSCWGFYGDKLEETGIFDPLEPELHDAARAAWENRFR